MYDTYAEDIYRFLLVHVRDSELAEDLTADTFAKAWKNIDNYDFKHPRGWLYAIARNTLTDHWRKKKTLNLDEELEIVDDKETNDVILDKKLELKRAIRAISKLPEEMKSVISLRFLQQYSVKQTAEALNLSESNVRVIQYRALKKLKKELS